MFSKYEPFEGLPEGSERTIGKPSNSREQSSYELTNLPNPYELFTKTKKNKTLLEKKLKNMKTATEKGHDIQKHSEEVPPEPATKITEGLEGKYASTNDDKKTDDEKKNKTKTNLIGMLAAVFFILVVVVGMIFYFNSNIMSLQKYMSLPYYTKTSFFQIHKGGLVATKITIFFLLLLIVFCLNLLVLDTVFKNNEYGNIFYITTMYYWGIVGITFLVVGNIPSLVGVFENTIGYNVLKTPLFNLNFVMNMFKNRHFQSEELKVPYDFLITTFDIPTFHEHFDKLCQQYPKTEELISTTPPTENKSDFYIDLHTWLQKSGEPSAARKNEQLSMNEPIAVKARRELLKMVLTKNMVGQFVWTLLSSYLVVILTINSMIQ